jgi:hypothetical protein
MECLKSIINCQVFLLIVGALLSGLVTIILIQLFKPKIHICTPEIDDIDWYEDKGTNNPEQNNEGKVCDKEKKLKNKTQKKVIKITVKNLCRRKAAINLRTEICVVHGKYTYHFDLDRQDFIMLPKRWSHNDSSERTYICYKLAEFTSKRTGYNSVECLIDLLNESNSYIRVRIHASHEFTGFGRVFNNKFCLKSELKFERVKENALC